MMDTPTIPAQKKCEYTRRLVRVINPDLAGESLSEVAAALRSCLTACAGANCTLTEYAGLLWEFGDGSDDSEIVAALLTLSVKYPELMFQLTSMDVSCTVEASNGLDVIYFHNGSYQDSRLYYPAPVKSWVKIGCQ